MLVKLKGQRYYNVHLLRILCATIIDHVTSPLLLNMSILDLDFTRLLFMKRFIQGIGLILLFFFASTQTTYATHLMGGEITWECDGLGRYVFTFKVYRDCSGTNISPNASGLIQIHNYPNIGQVTQVPAAQWTTVSDADISPNCSGPGSFSCANRDDESVFEYVRSFTRRLNGTPPPQGWIITYDDVARNANDNLVGQPGQGKNITLCRSGCRYLLR